jgi:hypothetical protein
MRTEDLIAALAADTAQPATAERPAGLRRRLLWSAALGFAVIAPLAAGGFGVRADLLASLAAPGVALKFALAATLALAGGWLAVRAAEPGRPLRPLAAAAPLAALALGCAAFWPDRSAAVWTPTMDGSSLTCLVAVAALAMAPLALFLSALVRGAPTRPALAGAAAGLMAGGLGAAAYAIHCPIDTPGYVATWYPAGALVAAAIGAVAGRRALVW